MKSEEERIKDTIKTFEDLLEEKSSKFYRADLHIHTLHSYDVKSDLTVEEYAEQLLKKANDVGLDIIAITDHNCIRDFDIFKKKADKYGILLLAGVEINVPKSHADPSQHPYVHVIALHESESMVKSILHALNIEDDCNPKTAVAKTNPLGLFEVIRRIHDKEGIAILAHSSGHKGFGNEFRDSYRIAIVEQIQDLPFFVEIRDEDDTKFFDGSDEGLNYLYRPCLFGSDCHTLGDSSKDDRQIGSRFSYLKMQEPNYQNLKKVLREPKLRVLRQEPPPIPEQRILGVQVYGGYFDGELFTFHPNLNVLIGGRGAGKSTLVNFIQFAFNDEPLTDIAKEEYDSKVKNLLSDGNSVYVYFYGNDNRLYVIKRTFVENIAEQEHTKLFYLHDNNLITEEIEKVPEVIETEIYGQGELVEIAKKSGDQLKLLDDYIEDKSLFLKREKECSYIQEKIEEIIQIQKNLEGLESKINEKENLEKRIDELTQHVKYDFVQNYQEWQQEFKFIQDTIKFLKDVTKAVYEVPFPKIPSIDQDSIRNEEEITNIYVKCEELVKELTERVRSIINENLPSDIYDEITTVISTWQEKYDKVETKYKSELNQTGFNVGVIVETLNKKKEELDEIKDSHIPEYKKLEKEISEIEKGIQRNLKNIQETDALIQKKRVEVVSFINEKLPNVKIEFGEERILDKMIQELSLKFKGNEFNIKFKERKFDELLKSYNHPLELFDDLAHSGKYAKLLENSSDKKLISILQSYRIDKGFISILVQPAPYHPKIQLLKDSDYNLLEELSLGEKCGTILSVILLQKSNPRVLIIDTPESEMDHYYFITQVVDTIGISKYHTQQIFVTHNPNIPVLADSELIHEIEAIGEKKGTIKQSGYLDCDETLESVISLEGGEKAFKSRSRRYGFTLN